MAGRTDITALIVAASCLAGGLLLGLLLRWLFAGLSRRAQHAREARAARELSSAPNTISWAELGWALLKGMALPALAAAGIWAAAEAVQLRPPMHDILNHALRVLVVLVVAVAAARLAAGVVRSVITARTGVDQSASIFVNVTRAVVLIVGFLVTLQSLGVSITPMLTALGVGGLAIALALQDTLANLFAGIQILASRKVVPSDFVRLDTGEDGYVVDITWRNTTIRQLTGNLVIVPNASFANAIVTNFHQPAQEMAIWFEVGVSYASDLAQVERVTVEVAREVMATVKGGVPDYEPSIWYHTFAESSVNFTVDMRVTEYTAQFLVVHEFIKRLHGRYRAEGIEIPFPVRTVVMPDTGQLDGRPPVPAARTGGAAD